MCLNTIQRDVMIAYIWKERMEKSRWTKRWIWDRQTLNMFLASLPIPKKWLGSLAEEQKGLFFATATYQHPESQIIISSFTEQKRRRKGVRNEGVRTDCTGQDHTAAKARAAPLHSCNSVSSMWNHNHTLTWSSARYRHWHKLSETSCMEIPAKSCGEVFTAAVASGKWTWCFHV